VELFDVPLADKVFWPPDSKPFNAATI